MLKNEYFKLAIKADLYREKKWVISAFSLIFENQDEWLRDFYKYRIVQNTTGIYFADIDAQSNPVLIKIDDAVVGQPLFTFKDPIEVTPEDFGNVTEVVTTTIGNYFFNASCTVYSFGNKVKFILGKVSSDKLEDFIAKRLKDTPKEGETRTDDCIYVDEYLKFVDAIYHLTNYSQLCIWAATPKTLVAAPGIVEYRNKLLEENKEHLDDAAVVAEIEKKLIAFDGEYLKGDPGGDNFLIFEKTRNVVRKKLFMMGGAESGVEGGANITLIKQSLSEGWEVDKFPAMNDTLRMGSYDRGTETQLGGEAVKWLLRASSNMNVTVDDCGTTLGKTITISKDNVNGIVGFKAIIGNEQIKIDTVEDAGKYLGKTIMVRSPMYCLLDKTDYCKSCIGDRLMLNPSGLSIAVSNYGSVMMSISLAAMHGKELATAKMDYTKSIT